MHYFPILLNLKNRPCLVVGGGAVATRKVLKLTASGARVTVVSPEVTETLSGLFAGKHITIIARRYQSADLNGMFLVIGATNDSTINAGIFFDAENKNILVNIADSPAFCNFILPAVIQRDQLIVAVSTCGASPAFAKKLRKDIEIQFGDEYGIFLKLMGTIRNYLLSRPHTPEQHKPVFDQLLKADIPAMIKNGHDHTVIDTVKKTLSNENIDESLICDLKQLLTI